MLYQCETCKKKKEDYEMFMCERCEDESICLECLLIYTQQKIEEIKLFRFFESVSITELKN